MSKKASHRIISGAHVILFSRRPLALRAFFKDKLGWRFEDAGGGWLIFALPPAELAVHPTRGRPKHELYFMCDDIHDTVAALRARGIRHTAKIEDQGWGLVTELRLPDGGGIGLYEPRHATPLRRKAAKKGRDSSHRAKARQRKPIPKA